MKLLPVGLIQQTKMFLRDIVESKLTWEYLQEETLDVEMINEDN